MSNSLTQRKAQLDKAEREHLEDIVGDMRKRVEDNVDFQLIQHELDSEPDDPDTLDAETKQLVEAIELEAVDDNGWEEAVEEYVDGVGYTIVNRLAALRCMEVRDFITEEVTVFKDNGLTPAAETLVHEEFLLEDEAILQAYHNICDDLAEEIEILFDRSTAYSLVDPDDDTFEELCGMLDEVPDEVWRADDVLGWVYEYYNRSVVDDLDSKRSLDSDDIGPANQFYTPHWVVRMLADNSLGKLYLEATNQESSVPKLNEFSPEERKERSVTPDDSPDIQNLCTYLIPDEGNQDAPQFDHPSEIRVIDPACGSGHFLLYAFDILERIWWAETDLDRSEIPNKILQHNLFGVDIDLRSCQLSALNLYLKARTRAEEESNTHFEMPNLGIVCADARVAEVEDATDVLYNITGEGTEIQEALNEVIEEFQTVEALGSLLDVQGTLTDEFLEEQTDILEWGEKGPHTLNQFLRKLEDAVEERTSDSFGEQNLRDFLNLLVVLTQDYDVALMNPPYGSRGRMPKDVKNYVEDHYEYVSEYYINFFEACDRLVKKHGRVGMLVPRSFMFKRIYTDFRLDFVGERGSFDFLSEFGLGILDNATVRTAGTVVRTGKSMDQMANFIRLSDLDAADKETSFLESVFTDQKDNIQRRYEVPITEFSKVPFSPLSYWTPSSIRNLHKSELKMDASAAKIDGDSIATAAQGLATGNNNRFLQKYWELNEYSEYIPYAKGGSDAWIMPEVKLILHWGDNGEKVKRAEGSVLRNTEYYGEEGLTWTQSKETGRRFGYFPSDGAFDVKGSMLFPDEISPWSLMGVLNSSLYHSLFLSLTPERDWQVGDVGRIPWVKNLGELDEIKNLSKKQYWLSLSNARSDPTSPYYIAPDLLADDGKFFYDHPHSEKIKNKSICEPQNIDYSRSIPDLISEISEKKADRSNQIEDIANRIDSLIYDRLDIPESVREEIKTEIEARTSITSRKKTVDIENSIEDQVKETIHHIAIQVVLNADDGIIPISPVENQPTLAELLVKQLRSIFGNFANERLVEIDRVLGARSSEQIPYPNIYHFVNDQLFGYHIDKMDKKPFIWEFQTSRLVADSSGEGFDCLVNYYQIDGSTFDRLRNHYLEPRKAHLREHRSAANRRQSDSSLSTTEQSKAAEKYKRCESGLEQISVFEDRLGELAGTTSKEWPERNQKIAADAAKQVAEFRNQTTDRLETLDELAKLEEINMSDLFSPSFYKTVENNREEWVDALDDLETAFETYAKHDSEPIEAHLYDLFEYYHNLVGSDHYASNGILFTTYYYAKFEDSGQTTIDDDGDTQRAKLLAALSSGLREYKALAEEISIACDDVAANISSEWVDRALSEITTGGYRPKHKHGVAINIRPLTEAEIVPEIVDKQVI